MYSSARQGVKEYRQCCNKRFTFTSCHLGNFTLMQYYTANQLYIVMNHLPFNGIATGKPRIAIDGFIAIYVYKVLGCGQFTVKIVCCNYYLFILFETAGSIFHYRKCLRQYLCEFCLYFVGNLFL